MHRALRACVHRPVGEPGRRFREVIWNIRWSAAYNPSVSPHCFQEENPNPPCGLLEPSDLLCTSHACITVLAHTWVPAP